MTANEDLGSPQEFAPARAVAPYTFQQLLERQVEKLGLDLAFHIHVPKASGGTVNVLFRQNNFFVLNFDMSTSDFFQDISEEQFLEAYRRATTSTIIFAIGSFPSRPSHFSSCRRSTRSHYNLTRPDRPDVIELQLHSSNAPATLGTMMSLTKGMSFLEYAANMHAAIGPQYSFFDDTGRGHIRPDRRRQRRGMPGQSVHKSRPLRPHGAI